jgi:hypothetical protein
VPLAYTVDHVRRRVLQSGTDPISPSEVLAVQDRQAADGAWSYRTLVDFARINWVPTANEMRMFTDHVGSISKVHGPRGPLAMVAGENTALFGMFRMYSILGEQAGVKIEAFTTVGEAEDWLGTL